jgi:hypothetical protein
LVIGSALYAQDAFIGEVFELAAIFYPVLIAELLRVRDIEVEFYKGTLLPQHLVVVLSIIQR